jgi:hypothetical protein
MMQLAIVSKRSSLSRHMNTQYFFSFNCSKLLSLATPLPSIYFFNSCERFKFAIVCSCLFIAASLFCFARESILPTACLPPGKTPSGSFWPLLPRSAPSLGVRVLPVPFSVPKDSPLPGATPAPGSRPCCFNSMIASEEPWAASRRRTRRCSLGIRLALYVARRSSGVGIGGRESMGVPNGVMMEATTWWTAVLTFRRWRLITSPWLRELLGSWTRWLVWSAKYFRTQC